MRDAGEQRVPGSSLLEYKSVCRLAFCTRFTKPSKPGVGQDGSKSAKDGGPNSGCFLMACVNVEAQK